MSSFTAPNVVTTKLSETTISVLKEISAIFTLFVCAAIPTLILALSWVS